MAVSPPSCSGAGKIEPSLAHEPHSCVATDILKRGAGNRVGLEQSWKLLCCLLGRSLREDNPPEGVLPVKQELNSFPDGKEKGPGSWVKVTWNSRSASYKEVFASKSLPEAKHSWWVNTGRTALGGNAGEGIQVTGVGVADLVDVCRLANPKNLWLGQRAFLRYSIYQ